MTRRVRFGWTLVPFLFIGASSASLQTEEPGIAIALSPHSVTVGDSVEVLLDVPVTTDGRTPQLPAEFDSWGIAEVVNAGRLTPSATEAAGTEAGAANGGPSSVATPASGTVRYRIELRSFRPGRVDLPPLRLEVPASETRPEIAEKIAEETDEPLGSWTTPAGIGFHVTSVLPADLEEGQILEPRPLAPPLALERRYLDRWLLATAGLAAIVLGVLFWKRRRSSSDSARGPSIPPFESLRRELERLTQLDATETVHMELSWALRRYLHDATGIPARERTSAEIRSALGSAPLTGEVSHRLVKLLRRCDEVKFSRVEVTRSVTRQRLLEARSIGETIEGELQTLRAAVTEEAAA